MRRADAKGWAVAPVNDASDIAHDVQLASRDYYQQVEHPALDRSLTLIGPFAKLSGTPAPPTGAGPDARRAQRWTFCRASSSSATRKSPRWRPAASSAPAPDRVRLGRE